MRTLIALFAVGALFAVAGCKDMDKKDHRHDSGSMSSSADVCPHCPGVQTATKDGKCPMCGANVNKM